MPSNLKDMRKLAINDEDDAIVGLDRWLEVVGRVLSCNGIPSLASKSEGGREGRGDVKRRPVPSSQGSLQLVEVLETAQFPRAIERFINQKAAVVGGPHVSG